MMGKNKSGAWKHVSAKKLSARKRGVFVSKSGFVPSGDAKKAYESGVCPKCGNDDLVSFTDADDSGLECEKCGWHCSFPIDFF
jgi:hypothetical protein